MATLPVPIFRHATTLALPIKQKTTKCETPGITGVDIWHIISYCPRKKDNVKSAPPSNTPEYRSRPGTSNRSISRCFILGPTRQQTEIYFKRKKSRFRKNRVQSLSARRLSARSDTGLRSRKVEVVPVEEKVTELTIQETAIKPKSSVPRLSSSSSIPASKNSNTNNTSEERSDASFYSELLRPMQYRFRVNKKESKEKVITPSKHGFHPRSQSPTFKRLIAVTDKLQNLFERESLRSDHVKDSLYDEDTGAPRYGSPTDDFDKEQMICNENLSVNDVIRIDAASSRRPEGRGLKDRWEIPKEYPLGSEHHSNEDTDSVNSSEVYYKVDLQRKSSDSQQQKLHLFLPQISDHNVSSEFKIASQTGNNSHSPERLYLPSINKPQVNNVQKPSLITVTRRHNRTSNNNSNNNTKKKKRVTINRCPSAKDMDIKILDHLNDVPTLISLDYEHENGHSHHDRKHGESACAFGENCAVHSGQAAKV